MHAPASCLLAAGAVSALVALAAAGCGAERSRSDDGGTPSDGTVAPTDGDRSTDARTGLDGAAGMDAGSAADAAPSDGGLGADGGSHPPAGYTLCGSATFTGDDARAACELTPDIGGALPYPVACGGATCTGGRYELWCPTTSGDGLYVWAELDGVEAPGTMCSVAFPDGAVFPLTSYGEIGGARYVAHSGAGGSAADLYGTHPTFLDARPTTVVVEGQAMSGGGPSGTIDLWIMMTPGDCPGSTTGGAPSYVLGIAASWATPDA